MVIRVRGVASRTMLWSLAVLAWSACDGADAGQQPPRVPAQDARPPERVAKIAAARACGQAGEVPTALPLAVAGGPEIVGRGTVHSGETRTIGAVELRHDPRAWIGMRSSGRRGPALVLEFPQTEANGGPYGGMEELRAGEDLRMRVDPYRGRTRLEVDRWVTQDPMLAVSVQLKVTPK